ncbi:MAG TPA: hypothetical protein VGC66_14160 [Pyrinomonadaceae bacterium]|jgi:uncharacterized repeat protein (TIGR01451 family)
MSRRAQLRARLSSLIRPGRKTLLLLALLLCFIAFAASEASAQVCGTPGKDGAGGSLSGIVNTYYPGNASASAGATSITLGTPTGSATTITTGDLLLVIQMQDAQINTTNGDTYGDGASGDPGSGSTALNQSGLYEFVVATSNAGGTVSIRGAGAGNGLINTYSNAAATGTRGQRRFQVVRVPQYSSATLSSGLTALAWNGRTGGILSIDVSGALSLGGAGVTVSVDGLGFRGGGAQQWAGDTGGANTDYVNVATNTVHGVKGEGIAGTPRYVYDSTGTVVDTGVEGYPGGSTARGAPGNAGGGGTDGKTSNNEQNSGGGGGGNGGTGGKGGNTWSSNLALGGFGGVAFTPTAGRIVMGGGGGAGSRNNSSGVMSSGGQGGGIVIVRAGTIAGSATITANGSDGVAADNDGGGGGGAGGSVVVLAASGGLGSLTVRAQGGDGGDAWITQATSSTPGERHGPGGGGAGGVVVTNGSPGINVGGGTRGLTTTALDAYGATNGGAGQTIAATASQIPGASTGAACVPNVSLNKSVSPNGTQLPGTDLTYTISFTNSGGNSARNLILTDPDPASTLRLNTNTYFKVGSVLFAPGTTGMTLPAASITYSNNNGSTFVYTPVSGGGSAPAGYDANVTHIRFSFTGNLSQTAPNNTGSVSFKVRIK